MDAIAFFFSHCRDVLSLYLVIGQYPGISLQSTEKWKMVTLGIYRPPIRYPVTSMLNGPRECHLDASDLQSCSFDLHRSIFPRPGIAPDMPRRPLVYCWTG